MMEESMKFASFKVMKLLGCSLSIVISRSSCPCKWSSPFSERLLGKASALKYLAPAISELWAMVFRDLRLLSLSQPVTKVFKQ